MSSLLNFVLILTAGSVSSPPSSPLPTAGALIGSGSTTSVPSSVCARRLFAQGKHPITVMENLGHYLKIVRFMYRLDEEDSVYVSQSVTSLLNWTFPGMVGGWLVQRLYLIERPGTPLVLKLAFCTLPLLFPTASGWACYKLYYENDAKLPALLVKYPKDTNFRARPKLSVFRNTRKVSEKPEDK